MFEDALLRPALGQYASLGSLYDARLGTFLDQNVLTDHRPEGATTTSYPSEKIVEFSDNDSFQEKSRKLGLTPGLGLSVLSKSLELDRSGRYAIPPKKSNALVAYRAAHVQVGTVHEALDFSAHSLINYVDEFVLHLGTATHVVVEVTWGARATVEAVCEVQSSADVKEAKQYLEAQMSRITQDGQRNGNIRCSRPLKVIVHTDIADNDNLATIDFAIEHMRRIFRMADGDTTETVVPVIYTLLPLTTFAGQLGLRRPNRVPIHEPSQEEYDKLISLYDSVPQVCQKVAAYSRRLKEHKPAVGPDYLVKVAEYLQSAHEAEADFKAGLSEYLKLTRFNGPGPRGFERLVDRYTRGDLSIDGVAALLSEYMPKLDFIDATVAAGGIYVSSNNLISDTLQSNGAGESYALFFSRATMEGDAFSANSELALQQLAGNRTVLLVDCDATGSKLEQSRLSLFQDGKLVLKDILGEQKRQAELCFIQYDERYVDRSVTNAPAQRKPVKIPCPGQDCGSGLREWICITCHVKVEYAAVDGFIYCDCGRVPFSKAAFNCQRPSHGPSFMMYPPKQLQTLLSRLPDPPEVNILILGESGVGKSTFINAFINYLTFQSLDQAMSAKELNWIIPCSFSTQRFDAHSESEALIEEEVRIGQDADEADGSKGQSATQKATVYPLYMDGKLVRLIDTPGIGDVRGPDMDRKNLANILSVLRNYKDLHGILMLLKPNNARLNVMFKFCVKELLGQLHRSAGRNMVFGFTNTRASNYQPGDTYQPLKQLLSEYSDVIKGLVKETVYCFDSESFRYLAARRQGIDMGNLADYRRSWTHSSGEAHRLVEHFQNLQPHRIQQTVSLNETRYLIEQLIQPMANISTAIFDSVAKSKKQIEDLANTRATGEDLKKKLVIEHTTVTATPLSRPKTVCAHVDCVSYTKDENGNQITLRKSLCHNPCCLTDVPPNQIGVQQVSGCAAFDGGQCRVCPHDWTHHEHIVIEYSVKNEKKTDSNVQRLLLGNGNEVSAKEAQIKALKKYIDEIQAEHAQISEAQAKFSHYLKKNTITHWNDATIEYFDHLIKDEKSKAGFGDAGSRARLDQLELDKKQYLQFVDAMKSGNNRRFQPLDEDGVHKLVQSLYNMQHYGSNLKDVADKVGKAYAATFRERPVRLRGHRYWQSRNSVNFRPSQLIETKPTRDMQRRTRQFSNEESRSLMSMFSRNKTQRSTPAFEPEPMMPTVTEKFSNIDIGIDEIDEHQDENDDADEWWDKDDVSDTTSHHASFHQSQNSFQPGNHMQQSRNPSMLKNTLRKNGMNRQNNRNMSQPNVGMPEYMQQYGQQQYPMMNGYQMQPHAVTQGFGPPVPVAANWEGVTSAKRSSWLGSVKRKLTRKGNTLVQ